MLDILSSLGNVLAATNASAASTTSSGGGANISAIPLSGLDGQIAPDASGLPGAQVAIKITNGIMFFSLLFCLVGLVLSAGLWAVGAFSNNYTQSVNGKKGFLICAGAALAIGAAYFLVSWFFGAGSAVSATS
jgi:hypothetical protein